jgi:hypothetical protein
MRMQHRYRLRTRSDARYLHHMLWSYARARLSTSLTQVPSQKGTDCVRHALSRTVTLAQAFIYEDSAVAAELFHPVLQAQ